MTRQDRKAAADKLEARRREVRRPLTSTEQQVLRISRQVRVIQEQIASLRKSQQRAA